jgi:hypothetical protein
MRELLTHTAQGLGGWQQERLTDGSTVYVALAGGQARGK